MLPPGLEPFADDPGRCAALFVDWQSCSDSGEELLDPVRGQYREFFLVVNAVLDGEHVTTCPYIWVDKDFALIRGLDPGLPQEAGQIDMTRSFGLDCRAEGRAFRRDAGRQRPAAGPGYRHARAGQPRTGRPTTTRR